MRKATTTLWKSELPQQLAEVLTGISDSQQMRGFLSDVMTEKEIAEISARLEAASMLAEGKKYTDIIARTKLSSRTIARISDWLQNGSGGYQTALQITSHQTHMPPARAE